MRHGLEFHAGEGLLGRSPVRCRQSQTGMKTKGDVVESREMGKEIVLLEERGDRSRCGGKIRHHPSIDENTPRERAFESGSQRQQRALAGRR